MSFRLGHQVPAHHIRKYILMIRVVVMCIVAAGSS